MSYTNHVEFQCSNIDYVLSAISTAEDELNNIETHADSAKDAAEEIMNRENDDFSPDEIRDLASVIVDEMTDLEVDRADLETAFQGTEDALEETRTACEQLRAIPDEVADSMYTEKCEAEDRADDAEAELETAKERIEYLEEKMLDMKQRIQELRKLNNPMLKIQFPSRMTDEQKLERWNS